MRASARCWRSDDGQATRDFASADLSRLTAPTEAALMLHLAEYPAMLTRAAASLAPHDVAFYARSLAAAFHSYYAAERFLVDDRPWPARAWPCWPPPRRC